MHSSENPNSTGVDQTLKDYYARRAAEYENIYARPERQADLATLRSPLRQWFTDQDVLEVACGTGYWTQVISERANSIVATDVSEEVLAIARNKIYGGTRPVFQIADAYTLDIPAGLFTAAFAGFWWSHIPNQRIREFLARLHQGVGAGGTIVFVDNNYVEGSSTPISRRDTQGNTFQNRRLEGGARFEVLKNFPTESELRDKVSDIAEEIVVATLKYYWCLSYRVSGLPSEASVSAKVSRA